MSTTPIRLHVDIRDGRHTIWNSIEIVDILKVLAQTDHEICLVDLDSALIGSRKKNMFDGVVQRWPQRFAISGGIHQPSAVEGLLRDGFQKVLVCSALFKSGALDTELLTKFSNSAAGDRLGVAIDFSGRHLVANAFTNPTKTDLYDAIRAINAADNVGVAITDINAALGNTGVDFDLVRHISGEIEGDVWWGGGILSARQLAQVWEFGFGAILGRGLFDARNQDLLASVFSTSKLYESWLTLAERDAISRRLR